MTKKVRQISDSARAIAIILAFLNLGWLGALVAKRKEWIWLLILWIIGIITIYIMIGIFILIVAWIWGLVVCATKRTKENSL